MYEKIVLSVVNRQMQDTDVLDQIIPSGDDEKYQTEDYVPRHDRIDHGITLLDYESPK